MSKKVRLELNSNGIREMLLGKEVEEMIGNKANEIAKEANSLAGSLDGDEPPHYVVKGPKAGGYGGGRNIAYVAAGNTEAYIDESRNHTLEKAVSGGGEKGESYSKRIWVESYTRKDGKVVAGHWRYYKKKDGE